MKPISIKWCCKKPIIFHIFQIDSSSEQMSVVVITNPMLDHLGHYVCSGNNSLGRDLKTVHLKGRTRKQDLSVRCWGNLQHCCLAEGNWIKNYCWQLDRTLLKCQNCLNKKLKDDDLRMMKTDFTFSGFNEEVQDPQKVTMSSSSLISFNMFFFSFMSIFKCFI